MGQTSSFHETLCVWARTAASPKAVILPSICVSLHLLAGLWQSVKAVCPSWVCNYFCRLYVICLLKQPCRKGRVTGINEQWGSERLNISTRVQMDLDPSPTSVTWCFFEMGRKSGIGAQISSASCLIIALNRNLNTELGHHCDCACIYKCRR